MQDKKEIYEFGDFRLDPTEKQLRRITSGELLPLPPKAFDLLAVLVASEGRLLEKNELLDLVWAESFVEEGNLKINVHTLRKAFGGENYIETVPRRGYRFAADVKKISAPELIVEKQTISRLVVEEVAEDEENVENEKSGARSTLKNRRTGVWAAICAVILLAAGAFAFFLLPPNTTQRGDARAFDPNHASSSQQRTIAVLPFKYIGEKPPGGEFLPESIFETLVTRLAKIKDLRVRSASSFLNSAETEFSPIEIGKKLQVDSILTGNLQKSGALLRINLQMISVADGAILWSEVFEENEREVFSIQDRLTAKIVNNLQINLSDAQRGDLEKRYTSNAEAEKLYLQGRVYWNERDVDALKKSVEYFERALREDPNYALAYVGLADSYQLLAEYKGLATNEAYSRARINATRALEIAPDLAEAHNSLAYTQAFFDWDFARGEASFKRALELNPNYATAHHWYSELLNVLHRFDEAWTHLQRARELDPFSASIESDVAHYYFIRRDYEKAIEEARKMIEKHPRFGYSYMYLYGATEKLGREPEAIEALSKLQLYFGEDEKLIRERLAAAENGGLKAYWNKSLEQARGGRVRLRPESIDYAMGYLHLGDLDQCFKNLDKSFEERNRWLLEITYDPEWDGIRSDPRYQILVDKIRLNP